jgi:nucleoside-diphosphate-sugar epimerase
MITGLLVTGCGGFIGMHTAMRLLEMGMNVLGIDNMNSYYDTQLKEYRIKKLSEYPNFTFARIDITDKQTLEKTVTKTDIQAVIHLAGQAGVRYSLEVPDMYVEANLIGTVNILEMMRKMEITKIILGSTSSVYGNTSNMPFIETDPVNEPISPYSASKKAAELMLYVYYYQYKLNALAFRFFTVYGPAGRPDMSVLRFIRWIANGEPIQLYQNGDQQRDFTYISDIVDGIISGLFTSVNYEIINLGGGSMHTINEMIKIIEKRLDIQAIRNELPGNNADMQITWANNEKARKLLNWKPKVSLSDGLAKTIDWYLTNKSWFDKISLEAPYMKK